MTGRELRDLRRRMGWTQQQVADYCGVTVRAVKHWEAGSRGISPPIAKLLRSCKP